MCGITGWVSDVGQDPGVLDAALRQLDHRGPDSSGKYVRGAGAVAQTRLAIIDLVTGDPPITNEGQTLGVALNGEIYNYRELRADLVRRGHTLRTRGDTEVLAHLAEETSAKELARRLEGMFAFAVWDAERELLTLARDRVGKKPLYYWAQAGQLMFASEIKALFAYPAVPRRLNPEAIPAYLAFGYVPTPGTFYEGIRSLPPGHVLTMSPGQELHIERYWAPPPTEPRTAVTIDQAAAGVRKRLTEAVERRLVADVPLGAFLSGGIDSSAVVGVASGLLERPLQTFTIGFEDADGFDERPYAQQVARRFGTDHTEFVVKPDAVDLIERLVWHHDQPFGDSSAIPTFLLCELTRTAVTVALSGDGGDELFAGYERFAAAGLVGHYQRMPPGLRGAVRGAVGALPDRLLAGRGPSIHRFADQASRGMPDAYLAWLSYVPEPARAELLGRADDSALELHRRLWKESRGAGTLERVLDLNLRTYLPDDLLVKADRMSMAHALEVRSPFLDRQLLEYAWSLPPTMKLRGLKLKRVLKLAVGDLLPGEVLDRRKKGFGVPLDRWFRTELQAYVTSMLGAGSRVRRHLNPQAVERLLIEHRDARVNHGHALWALLTLEVFLRREDW